MALGICRDYCGISCTVQQMLSPMYTLCILINRFLDTAVTLMKQDSFQAALRYFKY
jgi:hypothetical protein